MISASGLIWDSLMARSELDEKKRKAKALILDQDLPSLAEFALHTYFGEKNQNKRWYKPDVTVENVLDQFVSKVSPISPRNLVMFWKDIPSIREDLGSSGADKELQAIANMQGKSLEEPGTSYTMGENTLNEMSECLGDITPTMVNKIFSSGAEKLKKMTGGVSPEDMDDDDLADLLDLITEAREFTAVTFAKGLKTYGGNIRAFLEFQIKEQNLTPMELLLVSEEEIAGLSILVGMPEEEIEMILLADIEEDDNIFKTYQNCVSKKVFPNGKRGRPKGRKNKPKVVSPDNSIPAQSPESMTEELSLEIDSDINE